MLDKPGHMPQSLPVENYSPAIARALEWLGDRYLLARPINNAGHGHVSRRQRRDSAGSEHRIRAHRSIPDSASGNL